MTIYTNTAEGGTSGTTVTTGNSGGSSGDAFTSVLGPWKFDSTYKAHGSLGYYVDTTGAAAGRWLKKAIDATDSVAFRFYVNFVELPSAGRDFFRIYDSTNARQLTVTILSSNKFAITDNADVGLMTEAAAITANTWYRIEGEVDRGTGSADGTVHWRTYLGDSDTPITDYTGSSKSVGSTNEYTYIQFDNGASNTVKYALDDIKIVTGSTTPIGPVGNTAPTVSASGSQTVTVGTEVTVTATATDDDGTISSLTGAFTSTPGTAPTLTGSATGIGSDTANLTQTFTPTDPGTYTWQATGTDDASATGTDSTSITVKSTTSYPTSVGDNSGGWADADGAAPDPGDLSDDDDNTYAESPDNPSDAAITFSVDPYLTDGDLTITFRADGSQSGRTIKIELLQGSTVVATKTQALTTTKADYSYALTSGENAAITDRTSLNLRVTAS